MASLPHESPARSPAGSPERVKDSRRWVQRSDRIARAVRELLLAIAHAEQGKRTLLIDGDLRRPSVHRKFGFTANAGLSSVLLGEVKWPQVLVKIETIPELDILPAGPPSRARPPHPSAT